MNTKHIFYPTKNKQPSHPQPLEIDSFQKVLVFIPHPDDEAIGCGGLLNQLAQNDIDVNVILVSDGSGAGMLPEGTSAIRENEFLTSLNILGVVKYELWHLPDGKLNSVQNLAELIHKKIHEEAADVVISPWYLDIHDDHAAIGSAIKQCVDAGVCDALFYEIWTPLECTHILDITKSMEIKIKALQAHATALQYGHYLDAMIGLATYRSLYLPFEEMPKYGEAYFFYLKNKSFLSKILHSFLQ